MLRSTSVVITCVGRHSARQRRLASPSVRAAVVRLLRTRQVAFSLMVTSPVSRPTSPNSSVNSRNFWFDSALSGEV